MAESADSRQTAPPGSGPEGMHDAVVRAAAGCATGWISAFRRSLTAERDRWFLWLPVSFGVGIAVYFGLPAEPAAWVGPAGLVLALAAGFLGRARMGLLVAALVLGAAAAGFSAAQVRTAGVAAPVLEKRLGPVGLVAQVRQGAPRAAASRVVLQYPRIDGLPPEQTPARLRVRLTAKDEATLKPGDWLRLRAVLQPPPAPASPGAFDFARQAYFKRIGAVGFAVSHVTVLTGPPDGVAEPGSTWLHEAAAQWHLAWTRLRQAVAARVLDSLSGAAGGIAAALMTGERSAIVSLSFPTG